MKRFMVVCLGILFTVILVKRPEYWRVFRQDTKEYKTDTFYYFIKEEYREDALGNRLYLPKFSDLQDGDILVTDSTYCLCYRHGHAALVVDAKRGITLEAFGLGTVSKISKVAEWRRYPHVLILRLRATQQERTKVVSYAMSHLVGIPYRLSTGVVDDKDMGGTYWGTQCAHLVWAAYSACGYDIDGDGGWLVTPSDFVASPWLEVIPQVTNLPE